MADLKISEMTSATTLGGTELLPIVQSGSNKKITVDLFKSGLVESDTTGITGANIVTNIVTISQSNYDAISTPDANTIYIIV